MTKNNKNGKPFFRLHIADFLTGEAGLLTPMAMSAYIRLTCLCWQSGGSYAVGKTTPRILQMTNEEYQGAIMEMGELGLIRLDTKDGSISTPYLDKEFQNCEERSKTYRENISKYWDGKKGKNQ